MKVMLATDGSACARGAMAFAARVLDLVAAEVVVVSVASPPSPFLYGAPTALGPMPDLYYGEIFAESKRQAHEAVLEAHAVLGRRAKLIERDGDPARQLLAVAEEERPDLIVVGSNGRGLLGRALMGSVSRSLLAGWPGAVMVVRADGACPEPPARRIETLRQVMSGAVITVPEDLPLVEAARLMAEADVGALPVLAEGRLVGILTDRDIVVRGLAKGADAARETVGACCTRDLAVGTPAMAVTEAVRLMEQRKVRRLPVLEDGRLVGIVALGDLAETAPHRAEAVLVEISEAPLTMAHGGGRRGGW
jgi:CBS domain-containing protein/nucleotide-binding universal stress UspA family protein